MIIIGVVIVTIFMGALLIFSIYIGDNSTNDFYKGWWIGFLMMTLIVLDVNLLSNIIGKPTPSALDVYRGNTELEITSVNGVPTDSVVVYKDRIK